MTPDEHQRERRAFWDATHTAYAPITGGFPALSADDALAERDKRFPAPAAVEVAMPPQTMDNTQSKLGTPEDARCPWSNLPTHELTTLREKARLYDELCSVGDALADGYTDGIYPTEDDYEGALK